jgi:dihydrofolate synthase/folylpolyglutamate synthase
MMYRYQLERRETEQQYFTIHAPDRVYSELEITLAGQHQLENATAALATLDLLREHGLLWDEGALREGFRATRWSARMQVIGHDPTIIVDGAHNADSMQKLIQGVRDSFPLLRLIVVLSSNKDKDLVGMVQALAGVDVVLLTRLKSPRAVQPETFADLFSRHAPTVKIRIVEESWHAMDAAMQEARTGDLICATGSLYLAAEVLRWSAAHGNQEVAASIEGVDHE